MVQGFCPLVTPTSGGFRLKFRRFHIDGLHVVSLSSGHTRQQVSVTGLCNICASKISRFDIMQGQVVATICIMWHGEFLWKSVPVTAFTHIIKNVVHWIHFDSCIVALVTFSLCILWESEEGFMIESSGLQYNTLTNFDKLANWLLKQI